MVYRRCGRPELGFVSGTPHVFVDTGGNRKDEGRDTVRGQTVEKAEGRN